ncbi:uncharacterized protein LOC107825708 isoform X1 [Nicotiana tabacum]|uniref:Uncharacterized protein isoform X1 n=1 Tax=Nicotiana tabacum TaxID=4097 RepID=A0A1S4D3U2_TOBAC|nr:PREDICTED: uncharacterized protein LOC107825708 isoform X1 [Nicotiana tabacum]XP_016508084.1 PREDICTED: uncharacterized protein LOC107825708 isoform X1 [Nicotiana tabacum]
MNSDKNVRRRDIYGQISPDKKKAMLLQRRTKELKRQKWNSSIKSIVDPDERVMYQCHPMIRKDSVVTIRETSFADDEGSTSHISKGQQNVFPISTRKGCTLTKVIHKKNNDKDTDYVRLKPVPNCKFCNAKRFQYEPPGFCCGSGSVKLVSYELPNELSDLYKGNTEEAKHFRTYIRTYNNMFAFTSLGVTNDKVLARRYHGIYTFRVQGQIYHFTPDLLPSDKKGKNMQLYFYDNENELVNRIACSRNINESIVKKLMHVLSINPYSIFLKFLTNVPKLSDCYIALKCEPKSDQRVYNLPTTIEVAGIWVHDNAADTVSTPHICIYTHSDKIQSVKYYYGCYDPLQYPLLFSYGQNGWHCGIKKITRRD